MTSLLNVIPQTSSYKTTTTLLSTKSQTSEEIKPKQKKRDDIDDKVEVAAIAGGVIATLVYMLALAKSIKKKDFKFTDIFHIDYDPRTKFAGLAIPFRAIGLATSALVGGMTGGILADKKENTKPKLKEGVHQFLGNIITPITIIGTLTEMINKKKYHELKSNILSGLACIAGVCGGVVGGNYVATAVNNKLFNEHDERKLHVKDFGIHIDDILNVALLSDSLKQYVEKVIGYALPAIFQMCGYEAGTKNINSRD